MKPGIGCLSVFIGLRGTTEELGLKAQNLWVFTDSSAEEVFYIFPIWLSFSNISGLFFFSNRDTVKYLITKPLTM